MLGWNFLTEILTLDGNGHEGTSNNRRYRSFISWHGVSV